MTRTSAAASVSRVSGRSALGSTSKSRLASASAATA